MTTSVVMTVEVMRTTKVPTDPPMISASFAVDPPDWPPPSDVLSSPAGVVSPPSLSVCQNENYLRVS